jgi:hypothetical protein
MYEFEEDYEEYEPPVPKKRATISHDVSYYDRPTEELKRPPPRIAARPHRMSFRAFFVTGMLITLTLWALAIYVVIPWWNGIVDQWHYGDAKVFLTGADVGHGGYSQFLADDNAGMIVVVEIVNQKYTVYSATTLVGTNADHRIVTLDIRDVNNDGKLDVVVNVEGMNMPIVLLNNGKSFSWNGK